MRARLFPEREPRLTVFSEALAEALEGAVHPDRDRRAWALQRLAELPEAARSPLAAFVLVCRILEPDLALREQVVAILAYWLRRAPQEAREVLRYHLRQMRRRPVQALLEVAARGEDQADAVAALLGAAGFAARHLAHILEDRTAPLSLREVAANLLGRLGFQEALPTVGRVLRRLEGRANGQSRLPFAPEDPVGEGRLLAAVRRAWLLLGGGETPSDGGE